MSRERAKEDELLVTASQLISRRVIAFNEGGSHLILISPLFVSDAAVCFCVCERARAPVLCSARRECSSAEIMMSGGPNYEIMKAGPGARRVCILRRPNNERGRFRRRQARFSH